MQRLGLGESGHGGQSIRSRTTRIIRWSALMGATGLIAGGAMLVFGGGCATRALLEQTGVRVEVPVRFTRILATETQLIVEFEAYTDLSPSGNPYGETGPVAPRWAAVPILDLFAPDLHLKDKVRSGEPPLPRILPPQRFPSPGVRATSSCPK